MKAKGYDTDAWFAIKQPPVVEGPERRPWRVPLIAGGAAALVTLAIVLIGALHNTPPTAAVIAAPAPIVAPPAAPAVAVASAAPSPTVVAAAPAKHAKHAKHHRHHRAR